MNESKVILGDAVEVIPTLQPATADLVYIDPPFYTGRKRRNVKDGPSYDDYWPGGLDEYLEFLRRLLGSVQPLLSANGVIALHLDWRAAHHGRIELERLFGVKGFVNEIIWSYRTGGGSKRFLGRKHDTIHVFANGPDYTFNQVKEKSYLSHRYGFSNVEIHEDGRGPYTLVSMRDVWEIHALRGNQPECTGYPTQKPLALMTRLLECFTNPGDLVVDPCCGSGTTLVAALTSGRRSIGVDRSEAAVRTARTRLSHHRC